MLKKLFSASALMLLSLVSFCQIFDPVTWSFGYKTTGDNQYELVFTADIEKGSHIYAMHISEGGPIPTSFTFFPDDSYILVDSTFEFTKPEVKLDEAFGFKVGTLSNKAEFRQKITGNKPTFIVKGEVNFMACNNTTCSPPKSVEFKINITQSSSQTSAVKPANINEKPVIRGNRGLLGFFLLSMLAGFAGILTPCVFPMIPMTVAFFTRGSENRSKSILKAVIFGISIILIYSLLGIIVSLTSAGAGFANALSTHWIPNILFFILFIVFSASFFGAFEIILPNSWVSGADSKVDKGGMLAAFFMGLTTVIVSFSCTGPIVGALLVEAASGDVLRPSIGMFGFGLAFALPFTIFALFPSILSKMPRSGGWLNSVKIVLGFIMLAFSMKFLSTIDGVYSLGLISRDPFIAIWIVISILLGLYLLGKIKFSHDSDLTHISPFRLFLVISVFTFATYLFTGLFGAPLKAISALLPSQETSWFAEKQNITISAPSPNQSLQTIPFGSVLCSEPKYGDKFSLPYGLKGYFEYEQGLACAKESGKPVLIDFKGHACANCKLMEAKVWSDPEVLQRLRDNFVIVSLYADDRTSLPENEWKISAVDGKQKKTIGKVNEDIEISKYKTNALPLYIITDHEGNPLNEPMPANFNISEYKRWLDEGVKLFNEK